MRFKCIVILLAASVFLFVSAASAFSEADTPVALDHFSVTFPGSWTLSPDSTQDQSVYRTAAGGYLFLAPYNGILPTDDASVSAFFSGLCSGFSESSSDQSEEHEELPLEGGRCLIAAFTAEAGEQELRCFAAFALSGENGLLLVFSDPASDADAAKETFMKMVGTIRCTD